MKLLFDQNLSPSLVDSLFDSFPESAHVHSLQLGSASDGVVWDFARKNGYVIVSKDVDFSERSALFGHPPKVIWIRLGNCTTSEIEEALRLHFASIKEFEKDESVGVLAIFRN